MIEITRARSQNARALAAAILVGSLAGGVLGASYLGAARPLRPAPATVAAVSTSAPPPTASPQPAIAASVAAAPAPVVAAAPFRFAAVARGTDDLQCLTEAVYFESRGEPDPGQRAVAQVVLNRVRHPAFPKTICAVVHQKTAAGCQFSFACAPQPARRDETAWVHAQDIARGALHGAVMRDIGDATHFESVRALAFAGLLKVARIGEHVFYRFGGHDGAAGMFRQTPAPSAAVPKMMLASAAPEAVQATPADAPGPARVHVQIQGQAAPVIKPTLVATASPAPSSVKPAAAAAAPSAPAAVLIPASAPAPTVTPASVKTPPPTAVAIAS